MANFIFLDNLYPVHSNRMVIKGTLLGITEIGNGKVIIAPQPFDTFWGQASVDNAKDQIASIIFTGGTLTP